MKFIFNLLVVLCYPLSFCLAGTGDEFFKDWEFNITTLKLLNQNIDTLHESNHNSYFAKEKISEPQLAKTSALFKRSLNSTIHYFDSLVQSPQINLLRSSQADEKSTGKFAFHYYCLQLPIIKNLYDETLLYDPDSPYVKDLNQCIESVNFCSKHFTPIEETMAYFLKIKPNGKKGNLKNYAVYFNENDWFFFQRRQGRSILHRLNQMDLDKLQLPDDYKKALQSTIEKVKKGLSGLYKDKVLSSALREKSHRNLAEGGEVYEFSRPLATNQLAIKYALGVAYRPFDHSFKSGSSPEAISLSDDEKTLNANLLNIFLEEALARQKTSPHPVSRSTKRKPQPKKMITKSIAKPTSTTYKATTLSSSFPTDKPLFSEEESIPKSPGLSLPMQSEPSDFHYPRGELPPQLEGSSSEALSSSFPTDKPLFSEEESIPKSPGLSLPMQSEPSDFHYPRGELPPQLEGSSSGSGPSTSSSHDLTTNQDEQENDVSFIKEWLTDIIKVTQQNNEAFGVLQKAIKLKSLLEKNIDLLEQIQEATASLAITLQNFKQGPAMHSVPLKISEKLTPVFLEFMNTPLCYLKSLRFGWVTILFENLGIKVDTSMAGSRIHFSFKGKHTSIHLHDKHNGELDGGRISSLRKFLIDCNFIYKETESPFTQKSSRRGR